MGDRCVCVDQMCLLVCGHVCVVGGWVGGYMNGCVLYSLDFSKPGDMEEFVNMTGVDNNTVRYTCVWKLCGMHKASIPQRHIQ